MPTIDASLRALEIQGATVPKLGFGTWQIEGPECQDFELSDEERAAIEALPKDGRVIEPPWAPGWSA